MSYCLTISLFASLSLVSVALLRMLADPRAHARANPHGGLCYAGPPRLSGFAESFAKFAMKFGRWPQTANFLKIWVTVSLRNCSSITLTCRHGPQHRSQCQYLVERPHSQCVSCVTDMYPDKNETHVCVSDTYPASHGSRLLALLPRAGAAPSYSHGYAMRAAQPLLIGLRVGEALAASRARVVARPRGARVARVSQRMSAGELRECGARACTGLRVYGRAVYTLALGLHGLGAVTAGLSVRYGESAARVILHVFSLARSLFSLPLF